MMVRFQGLPQINTLPRLTLPGAHVSDLHSLVFFTGNPPRSPVLADGPILALGVLDTHGLQMPPSLDCRCCCSVAKSCPTLCEPLDCITPGSLAATISQSLLGDRDAH